MINAIQMCTARRFKLRDSALSRDMCLSLATLALFARGTRIELFEPFQRPSAVHPQTVRATSATSSSFRRMSSQLIKLPEAAEAKPHCVLTARFSIGTYLD